MKPTNHYIGNDLKKVLAHLCYYSKRLVKFTFGVLAEPTGD